MLVIYYSLLIFLAFLLLSSIKYASLICSYAYFSKKLLLFLPYHTNITLDSFNFSELVICNWFEGDNFYLVRHISLVSFVIEQILQDFPFATFANEKC